MRIITVNRNYFLTGGPEKYLFSLQKAIEPWEFIPFAVDFTQNIKSPYSSYFVSPPSKHKSIRFENHRLSFWQKISYAARSIYSFEAKSKFLRLVDFTKPQAAFFLNAVYFSQSIIDACRQRNLPVIWRLSDFNLICGNYLLYRDGHSCEQCVGNGLYPLLKNRCGGYQRSISAAFVRYIGMQLSRFRNVYRHISYFVCPSKFTRNMLIRAGFPIEKVVYLPTFVAEQELTSFPDLNYPTILFVGRFSNEKGVHVLLKAVKRIKARNWRLLIAGGTKTCYERYFKTTIDNYLKDRVLFSGFLPPSQIFDHIKKCHFCIVPSLCYENQPNTVLEAMSLGRPVIASRLGSLEETVADGVTGLLFEPGNPNDLTAKIEMLISDPEKTQTMGKNAYHYVKTHHSVEDHIQKLKQLLISATSQN